MNSDLVAYLARSALIGLMTMTLLALNTRKSASVRHAVAIAGLAAMLALGPMSFLSNPPIPALSKRLSIRLSQNPKRTDTPDLAGGHPFSAPPPASRLQGAEPTFRRDWLLIVWELGAGLLFLRLAAGLIRLGYRISRSIKADIVAPVTVLVDSHLQVPMTAWWGRSVVLVPAGWNGWPHDRLSTVLKHELGHVSRFDWWTQLIGTVACIVCWPNPFAWFLARAARSLAEQSVDDLVLASGVPNWRYANDLLEIAVDSRDRFAGLLTPMATKANIARRIEMVLDEKRIRGSVSAQFVLMAASGFAVAVMCLSSIGVSSAVTPVTGRVQHAEPPAAQYRLATELYLAPRDANLATFAQRGSSERNVIVSAKDLVALRKYLKAMHADVVSSPTILTLDSQPASIHISSDNWSFESKVVPKTRSADTVTLSLSVVIKTTSGGTGDLKTTKEDSWKATSPLTLGDAMCVLSEPAKGSYHRYVYLCVPTILQN
jgi:hypothetical protein